MSSVVSGFSAVRGFPARPEVPSLGQGLAKNHKAPGGPEARKIVALPSLPGEVWETGEEPIEKVILGGAEIADTERVMGYGAVRYFEAGEVKKIAAALESYPIQQKSGEFQCGRCL